jgi:hypothetical protein
MRISNGGGFGKNVAEDVIYYVLAHFMFQLPEEKLQEFRKFIQDDWSNYLNKKKMSNKKATSTSTPSSTTVTFFFLFFIFSLFLYF